MIPFHPIPAVLTSVELYEMYAARHGQVSQVLFDHKFEVIKTRKPYTNIYTLSYSVSGMNLPRIDFRIRLYEALSKLRSETEIPKPDVPKPAMRDIVKVTPIEETKMTSALSNLRDVLGQPASTTDEELIEMAADVVFTCRQGLQQIRDKLGV